MHREIKDYLTKCCLIAADIDKTYLHQKKDIEKTKFLREIAPQLCEAAENGTNLAVVTGNSMKKLSTRFLKWLVESLVHLNGIDNIDKFHFFCNAGGIYIHFPKSDPGLLKLINSKSNADKINEYLLADKSDYIIKPSFYDLEYIKRTKIEAYIVDIIESVLVKERDKYIEKLKDELPKLKHEYYINEVPPRNSNCETYEIDLSKIDEVKDKFIDKREIALNNNKNISVQITLRPILSWYHSKNPEVSFKSDIRTELYCFRSRN